MTPNNNLSVLPWYNNLSFQNHRKSYAYGAIFPLITPPQSILPFQLVRSKRSAALSVSIYTKDGFLISDITSDMIATGLIVTPFNSLDYDVISYSSSGLLSTTLTVGLYYLVLTDGIQTWYSDMFNIVSTIDNCLKITWSDEQNVIYEGGQIVYQYNGFKNIVYLDTEIGKPEYIFEEEGEKRDGYFFPEKQISEKTYNFTFLAPEYLIDAMRIIRMSDFVEVQSKGQKYTCDTFLITPKWEVQGDLAVVSAEFQCDTVIKKIGRSVTPLGAGDYNNDFNNDYSI